MTFRAHYRNDLALSQLETALRLYFARDDYASVVTLAGAAEEVFGKLLTAAGKDSSLESLKKAACAIHERLYGEPTPSKQIAERANRAKNSLKHWDKGDPILVKFDLEQESKDILFRAIDNYWLLEEKLSPAMEKFQREVMAA